MTEVTCTWPKNFNVVKPLALLFRYEIFVSRKSLAKKFNVCLNMSKIIPLESDSRSFNQHQLIGLIEQISFSPSDYLCQLWFLQRLPHFSPLCLVSLISFPLCHLFNVQSYKCERDLYLFTFYKT